MLNISLYPDLFTSAWLQSPITIYFVSLPNLVKIVVSSLRDKFCASSTITKALLNVSPLTKLTGIASTTPFCLSILYVPLPAISVIFSSRGIEYGENLSSISPGSEPKLLSADSVTDLI